MSVTVKYIYTSADGKEIVNFVDWSKTLSEAEQKEIANASARYKVATKLKVNAGLLEISYTPELTYTWATQEAADAGVGEDPTWESYQARYLAENNIKLEITKE
jgi:hypothetical protein